MNFWWVYTNTLRPSVKANDYQVGTPMNVKTYMNMYTSI